MKIIFYFLAILSAALFLVGQEELDKIEHENPLKEIEKLNAENMRGIFVVPFDEEEGEGGGKLKGEVFFFYEKKAEKFLQKIKVNRRVLKAVSPKNKSFIVIPLWKSSFKEQKDIALLLSIGAEESLLIIDGSKFAIDKSISLMLK